MTFYAVTFSSPSARYGPSYIQADSPEEAKKQFNIGGAFTPGEMAVCVTARLVSLNEVRLALGMYNERSTGAGK